MIEYLLLRQKELCMIVGGLANSRKKCGDEWTDKDELELIKVVSRQKEVESLITKFKNLEYYIEKSEAKIKHMQERRK